MSPKISDGQIKYIILSIKINAMASRALLLDVAPSKILGVYHITNHLFVKYCKTPRISTERKEVYCNDNQNARI